MKVSSANLCGIVCLLGCLPVQAYCDTQQNDEAQTSKPVLRPNATGEDLDKYVEYFRHKGYVVLERQQQLNGAGTIVAFHFRAICSSGGSKPTNSVSSIETWGSFRTVTEKLINRKPGDQPTLQSPAGIQSLAGKPTLTTHATGADLDNYVLYFRQHGYVVSDRRQRLNTNGTLVSFHLHAVRPQGKLTSVSPSSFVDTSVTPQRANETVHFGPIDHKTQHS